MATGLTLLALLAAGIPAQPAAAGQDHVKIGVLTCAAGVEIGLLITSGEKVRCSFVPDKHESEHYYGHIRKFGLDIGITAASVIVWAVLAAEGTQYTTGALAGTYAGVSAEETLALGLGANLLIGGSNKGFVLQPLSVQGQAGLNLAVGVSVLELEHRR
ncbi:MAG: DUF992 domain-containing protein [Bauldia sp.]|nr:DUF992 domain-containing protein [Bauldia sp.]